MPKQPKAPAPREPTAREKAKEFAKQVPRPKARPPNQAEAKSDPQERITTKQELEELDAKNKMYANELEKIK